MDGNTVLLSRQEILSHLEKEINRNIAETRAKHENVLVTFASSTVDTMFANGVL